MYTPEDSPFEKFRTEKLKGVAMSPDVLELVAKAYEGGFIDGMQKQMQSSVDRAVNRMAEQPAQQQEPAAGPHKWGCRANAFGECNMGCTSPQPAQQQCMEHGECFGGECIYPATQPAQQQEFEELTAQRDQLADILTRTANALKGQPAELSLHSWHDLPEVAQQLRAAQQHEPVAYMNQNGVIHPADYEWEGAGNILTPLYTHPLRKPLTDEQRNWIVATCPTPRHIIDTVEKMHGIKEKNHG